MSRDDFLFTRSTDYPNAIADFEKSFATLTALRCDILMAAHPGFADLLGKFERRERGGAADAFIDANACRRYADDARERLRRRLAEEAARAAN